MTNKLSFWITIDSVFKQKDLEKLLKDLNDLGYDCYFHQGGRIGVVQTESTETTGQTTIE